MSFDELDEKLERKKERLEDGYPDRHDFQDESTLKGTLKEVNFNAPTTYGRSAVVIVETPTGTECSVWLFHRTLKQAFVNHNPKLGDDIGIVYGGEKNSESNPKNSYHVYDMVVSYNDTDNKSFNELVKQHVENRGPDVEFEDEEGTFEPDDELPF